MSHFGQPPLAAFLPLRAGQNLSDVPDKAAALANLGTLSSSDIMLNAVPIGTIIPFWGNTAPVGYLPCNGQTINSGTFPDLVTFLGGGSSQVVPDLRGEFLRGWDNGRGIDTGRAVKTLQAEDLKSHTHGPSSGQAGFMSNTYPSAVGFGGTGAGYIGTQYQMTTTGATGGTETRPRNVSVLYCIKAYGALVNTSTANMGNVLTELSQCTKLTQFEVSLAGNGYQKLPNGLIVQWGNITTSASVGNNAVSFPITFPTVCASISLGFVLTATANYYMTGTNTKTTTGFNIYNPQAAALGHYWIAIGY